MKKLSVALLIAGLSELLLNARVYAQDYAAIPWNSGKLEEVIVTARRVEEDLQKVPVAITAFTKKDLEDKLIFAAQDLQYFTPGMVAHGVSIFGDTTPNFSIRGQRTVAIKGEPAVASYFADAPAGPALTARSIFDLQSIQVLKGPQGTLFGKNSTGGAILYTPVKPTSSFEGSVNVRLGNYNSWEVTPVLNVPLGEKTAIRLAGNITRSDGYTDDITNGLDLDDQHNESWRVSLRVEPFTDFANDTIYSYFNSNENGPGEFINNALPCQTVPNPDFDLLTNPLDEEPVAATATCFNGPDYDAIFATLQGTFGLPSWQEIGAPDLLQAVKLQQTLDIRKGFLNEQEFKTKTWAINNTTTYEMGVVTLKNIFSFAREDGYFSTDIDGTALPILQAVVGPDHNRDLYTEELQAFGEAFADKLSWIVGAYYEKLKNDLDDSASASIIMGATPLVTQVREQQNATKNESVALYTQLTYLILDDLKLTGGLRYNRDERSLKSTGDLVSAAGSKCIFLDSSGQPIDPCLVKYHDTFDEPTWTVSLEYQVNDNLFTYLSHRHGYKAGGFDAGQTVLDIKYKPETVDDLEWGVKSNGQFMGNPGQLNVALYYNNYDDIQRTVTSIQNNTPAIVTENAAKAHAYGLEIESQYRPNENLLLSLFYAYFKSEYDKFVASGQDGVPFDASDNDFANAPENSGGASLTYFVPAPVNWGSVSTTVSFYAQSKQTFSDLLVPLEPDAKASGYSLVDVNAYWREVFKTGFSLGVYVKNVFDKEYVSVVDSNLDGLGYSRVRYGAPLTYGIQLAYEFGGD